MAGRAANSSKLKKSSKKQVKQKGILTKIRNYFIYSIIMLLLGGSAEHYKKEIINVISTGYKPAIEKVFRIIHTSEEYFSNSQVLKSSEKQENSETPASLPKYNEIIKHKYYILGYNEETEQANWVSYTLTKEMVLNSRFKRKDDFRPDPYVKTGSSELSDYRNSGYDRGHLCPAADMSFDKEALDETFYMSNMSPQVPEFNRGIWKKLEDKVRDWALKFEKVYVVTGPIFYKDKKHKEIGHDKVDVPDAFYKVILVDNKDKTQAIGFIIPNAPSSNKLIYYSMPVRNVEKITNINFFSFLPKEKENNIEKVCNYYSWS